MIARSQGTLNLKGPQISQQAIDRFRDLLRIQWLQKIIYRLQPEGVRGAVRVSRRKDQTRRLRKHGQLGRQRNTVFARQINVEKTASGRSSAQRRRPASLSVAEPTTST